MADPILILGASARAAAFSARRAGLAPIAVDMFADVDLQRCCPTARVDRYPHGFRAVIDSVLRTVGLAGSLDSVPWIYTGALENWPALVDSLAAARPLLGNPAAVLKRVRDPRQLGSVLAEGGFRFPDIATDASEISAAVAPNAVGEWLVKPRSSSGGSGIVVWDGERLDAGQVRRCYLQRRVDGDACSAVYVAAGHVCRLLGVTRQLIGTAWAGANGFRYCGSVGPLDLEDRIRWTFEAIGRHLSDRFKLVGLFGVDAILSDADVWTVEVNPRYTASIEILERANGVSAIAQHVTAFRDGQLPVVEPALLEQPSLVHGKVILYTDRDLMITEAFGTFTEKLRSEGRDAPSCGPRIADIPAIGSHLPAGWPITTLFASAADEKATILALRTFALDVRKQFFA